ncbi:hypothetical protein CEUSTIGMA_g1434.t1 [Chlamydomonas eustigma]|uniref:Uncharacterized protein n=1 Tax=Chlamydomonas eustigma TaxID=1157962 RepID=A0A250WT20_9CHLO|nr:hypothetical protein CEUSTIGMA_g1434.t1 [Chlamydomonas eustigma]|eukprot:GAX73984.1 hypothetical protein CEUSTIGMA_g1434.t1 [Chlamydomonas eustigma]
MSLISRHLSSAVSRQHSFLKSSVNNCPTTVNTRSRARAISSIIAMKQVISTEKAPAALGPYSQAIRAGNTLYVSGQIGLVPGTKDFASADVEGQTEQVMKNMGAILEAAGASYANVVNQMSGLLVHVVKTTILLADIHDFPKVNAIYGKYFPEQPPARATFAVKDLPMAARVEIEATAVIIP